MNNIVQTSMSRINWEVHSRIVSTRRTSNGINRSDLCFGVIVLLVGIEFRGDDRRKAIDTFEKSF